jgi:hypothetical protein
MIELLSLSPSASGAATGGESIADIESSSFSSSSYCQFLFFVVPEEIQARLMV